VPHFTDLVDLAAERLGGAVVFATDDYFAPKENLLKAEPAVFVPDRYTDRGKWMDGWESRRRRTPGHDFCVVRLGLPGAIRGVDVDTAHFKGNHPEACSLEAACAPREASADILGNPAAPWTPILARTPLRSDTRNLFPIAGRRRFTHLRFHIYPDGGVARLRVHGDVAADWRRLETSPEPVDLAALENGGFVLASSDSFFGSHQNLLMPGRAASMKDGWETKRSRRPGTDPGSDWVIVRLGTRGVIRVVEVDTNHFKGNYPDRCSLEVSDAPGAEMDVPTDPRHSWRSLLPETPLEAHKQHFFEAELAPAGPATHVRLRIYPDGGVSRLRLYGRPAPPDALKRLNAASREEATRELLPCCGSTRWASRMAAAVPLASPLDLLAAAEELFEELNAEDWLEAFRAHPRIGDRAALKARFASGSEAAEQAGAHGAPEAVLDELAARNAEYEKRFGHIFIICATNLSASRMLASLRERLTNPPDIELSVAADEQRKITRLRIRKLLSSGES
jgi:allantoicase